MTPRRGTPATLATALAVLLASCSTTHSPAASTITTVAAPASKTPATTLGDLHNAAPPADSTSAAIPFQPAGITTGVPAAGAVAATSVNPADPNAIAIAVVTTLNRQDSTIDASPLDALRRARRWLTPTLLADCLAVPQRGDADWTALAKHRGYTTVDHVELANETGQPPNTTTTTIVQLSYEIHQVGRDSWRGPKHGPQLQRLELTRTANTGWQVNGFSGAQ